MEKGGPRLYSKILLQCTLQKEGRNRERKEGEKAGREGDRVKEWGGLGKEKEARKEKSEIKRS